RLSRPAGAARFLGLFEVVGQRAGADAEQLDLLRGVPRRVSRLRLGLALERIVEPDAERLRRRNPDLRYLAGRRDGVGEGLRDRGCRGVGELDQRGERMPDPGEWPEAGIEREQRRARGEAEVEFLALNDP